METKTCCVTGHRDIPKEYLDYVEQELRREVQAAIEDGFTPVSYTHLDVYKRQQLC